MLQLDIPRYRLNEENVFNFREREWANSIVENVTEMLQCGEDYGIRIKSISIDNPDKIDLSELKKTLTKTLNIVLTYADGEKEQEVSYDIPWLTDNHFYISGNYKVAVYQLFDFPLVVKGDSIKLRTNIHSFMLEKNNSSRSAYNYYISMFGKKFPFAHLVIAFLGVDEVKSRFHLNDVFDYEGEPIANDGKAALVSDISSILQNDTIDKTRLLAEYFPRKFDNDICEDVRLITKIDIFTQRFMHTNTIVDELLYAIETDEIDDSDYANKRLRFIEQIMFVHICKDFYNLISFLRKNKRGKFSNNSKVVLSNVNQSPITQFDFSLNPLAELALLTRTSLSGTGGFKKNNVPVKLRDIHPTMQGRIDTADTADRDGCGTIQYLTPTIQIEGNGTFHAGNDDVINSISISHVPFLEHDDATRLQMSSSQQRHSIMLKHFDVPLIQSGVEGMYTDQTSFMFRAERNGSVIYKDNDTLIVQYDNNVCKAFDIGYRKLYLSVADFFNVYFEIGDTFSKGDILAESNYLTNGRLTIGCNLLTAVMVWYGYNYEDGIIISEKLVEKDKYTSVHYLDLTFEIPPNKILENLNDDPTDYKPLPNVFDRVRKGEVFAKIRTLKSEGFQDVIFEPVQEHIAEEDCIITDIQIFANKWDKSLTQYDDAIKTLVANQKEHRENVVNTVSQHLTREELERYLKTVQINRTEKTKGNYKIKGDSVDGIRIEITAMYERKISVGDKLGNRHGNKGIISAIIPEDKMPTMPDGRKAEIIINPLGIPSRMNIGQLFELHLAMSVMDLKKSIRKKVYENATKEDIDSYILGYMDIIDKSEDRYVTQQMREYLESVSLDELLEQLNDFYIVQPPFESIDTSDLHAAMEYTETPYEYPCFDPVSGKTLGNEVAFGYQYFMKLNHIAKDKIAARGTGPYAAKTAQPLAGKSRKGGQRLGEMEIWAIAGHGGEANLNEFITTKSDSIQLRNRYTSQKMSNDDMLLDDEDDSVSQSLRLLQTNLKTMGVDYELEED